MAEIRAHHHDEFLCRVVAPQIACVTISMQDPPRQVTGGGESYARS